MDALKVAVRAAVDDMPVDMVRSGVMHFYKRVCLCVESEGGVFKHKKFEGEIPIALHGELGGDEEGADE